MADLVVELEIARPRAEVLAWWTGFPDDYRAVDPKEQPHRIKVTQRSPQDIQMHTFWQIPWLGEVMIPETLRLRPDGNFDIDAQFPLGVFQRDKFTFSTTPAGTHAHIVFDVWSKTAAGQALRAVYVPYICRTFPRAFARNARLCERDAPHL